jgi:phosphoserine/homoserine phosphotransferase
MNLLCLDMEGVLTPEIWHHVRHRTGIAELGLTTRDVKDYRELMDRRVEICARHNVTLADIQAAVSELEILDGAREFLDWARARHPVFILSDTFYEFAEPLLQKLGYPVLLCHNIAYDSGSGKLRYTLRQEDAKRKAVEAMRALNFRVAAVGDSYNDIPMLRAADTAAFFRAPESISREFPVFPSFQGFAELREFLTENLPTT